MADVLWPGDHRADGHLDGPAIVRAALRVETAWLAALAAAGVAPPTAAVDVAEVVGTVDAGRLAVAAEGGGNLVIPLVALVRERLRDHPDAARWVHRGLTSQDVLDTALVLNLRETVADVLEHVDAATRSLAELADRHRGTLAAGRTLTQLAVPITFGLKAAQWLQGVLDARDDLRTTRAALPVQLGGAAGTLAATAELVRLTGAQVSALDVARDAADRLQLPWSPPWHTQRAPLTRVGDALARATDAFGRIASDVLVLGRPEIGEVREPAADGRGGSSTMPHKANPVLSVLVRRAAVTAPGLAAQLHLCAALGVDERPDGAWHAEWEPLARLGRHALTAAAQTAELVRGLEVDAGRLADRVAQDAGTLLAEQRGLAPSVGLAGDSGRAPGDYLGATDAVIDAILRRAGSAGAP